MLLALFVRQTRPKYRLTLKYHSGVVSDVINGIGSGNASKLLWVGSISELERYHRASLAETVQNLQTDSCDDKLEQSDLSQDSHVLRAFLNAHLQEKGDYPATVTHCHQVQDLWLNMSQGRLSNMVRLVCPDTCGCTDPRSAYLFAEEPPYCAASCMKTSKFRREHDKIDCVDMPPHELREKKMVGVEC